MYLRWLNSFLIVLLIAFASYSQTKRIYMDELNPGIDIFRGVSSEGTIKVPVPYRWNVKSATLHIEIEKSKALVKERSGVAIFFNDRLIYQTLYNPKVDVISADIDIPLDVINKDYNDLKLSFSHHYCMNCCEYEASPELWSKVNWEKSYIEVHYTEKPFVENLLYVRDYMLDSKQYSPIEFGIILEDTSDFLVTQGAKVSGYLGKTIKYRKIFIDYVKDIVPDKDIILIGKKSFVKKLLNLNPNEDIPQVFVKKNPLNDSKAVVVITADTDEELENAVNAFISIDEPLVMGKNLNISKFVKPDIKPYTSPLYIPLGEDVYFSQLVGYDGKFYGIFPPPYDIYFHVPPDLFIEGKEKINLHLAYNYGAGLRQDSVINIFLNDKFVKAIKVKKNYGTILEEVDIRIPVYMLSRGPNKLTISYALMPSNQGFCVAPNIRALRGIVFSKKSYINIPELPHWIEMAYLELFVSSIYPYSIYPDLKDTQIYLSSKDEKLLSALFTLMAYVGEKTLVSPYRVSVVSSLSTLDKTKNIIALGNNLPSEFYKNLPIFIGDERIDIKYPILKTIEGLIKDKKDFIAELLAKNRLTNEVIYLFGESPYKSGKTILVIVSNNADFINRSIQNLYDPKYSSKIKGDVAIVDFYKDIIFSTNIGDKYYVGHLPFINYILYKIGYSFWVLIGMFFIVILLLVVVVKVLLDYREKRRLRGEI